MNRKVDEIVKSMHCWYTCQPNGFEDMRAKSNARRTEQQRVWDHAILAVAEFVRRLDGYNETRALAIHELLSTKLPNERE